ncbi:MAG: protein phosphatase 2C domain-containing protein [Salegentibacter sp.]
MVTKDVHIFPPQYLNEVGKRSNNEDAVYPDTPSLQDHLFMVCDGVGGQNKGEVASRLTCSFFSEFLLKASSEEEHRKQFEEALSYTEARLAEYIKDHPECEGMASTLTAVLFTENYDAVHIAWVGDSRIYHIRNKKILFRTKDHSEVQNLIDVGEITPEEARDYPRKNVILRAVSGSSSPTRLDYRKIEDVRDADFFFLCSDGILEKLREEELKRWFSSDANPLEIRNMIFENIAGRTRDNFSMYLIKLRSVKPPE